MDHSSLGAISPLIAGLISIPIVDQSLKLLVLRRLEPGSVPLGRFGRLEVVRARIWIARGSRRPSPAALWTLWALAASGLTAATALAPSLAWSAGLILGGSLSHGVETSRRGWVCDYVCLRFWPAFNLADVALAVGAVGMGVGLLP